MYKRMMVNDFKKNKLVYASICIFMAISAMLIGVTTLLFGNLMNSIDNLMETAKTPDFLQMHAGEIAKETIYEWAESRTDKENVQVVTFLNIESGMIMIAGKSLENSTQDDGLCIQNDKFDYLVGMDGEKISVNPGEVYVPVCYKNEYGIEVGDTFSVASINLRVAGFLRDSQMNSMMASSKRFLVNEADYERFITYGSLEYLIEFDLIDGADINSFATAYSDAMLPANGPTITFPLIKMMNALSDGVMILVILLVSVVVLAISLVCIRYILLTSVEKDRKEAGMLKAIGISKKDINRVYITKYIILAGFGLVLGSAGALILAKPLGQKMRDLYGASGNEAVVYAVSLAGIVLVEVLVLLSIRRVLKKLEKVSVVSALRGEACGGQKNNKYALVSVIIALSVFMMIVPQNISSTISNPGFVSYMGIGDCDVMMDVREASDIMSVAHRVKQYIESDSEVSDCTIMLTKNIVARLQDGTRTKLLTEVGDHSVFPVKYSSGTYPKNVGEIALSNLNATQLNVKVGDKIELEVSDEVNIMYTICGIYSDITNGGKTAKICEDGKMGIFNEVPTMWCVSYISLSNKSSTSEWIERTQKDFDNEDLKVRIIDIKDRVIGTYGSTIDLMVLAGRVAILSACLIIFVVVLLFMRLIIWKERSDSSLKKALGICSASIKWIYIKKSLVYIMLGTAAGIIMGIFGGQVIAGQMLNTLGASGFKFIVDFVAVLVVIPFISVAVSLAAVKVSVREVENIKAYECCVGRE